jgi:hypothetical protein
MTAGESSRSWDTLASRQDECLPEQPFHIIAHSLFQWESWLIPERTARVRQIGLRKVLVMGVWVIDVIGLKTCAKAFVKNIDQFVKRARLARAKIINSARLRIERANAAFDGVLHVNKVALLFAVFENARVLAGFHLLRQMINHARWHAFVRFTWPVNVEVTQTDDDPIG